jgi:hypothetical protein
MPGGELSPHHDFGDKIRDAIRGLVAEVPDSGEVSSLEPKKRAEALADKAAWRSAGVAGAMAFVPGPAGILTIIPALVEIWRIQRQLVSDIAACYGKTPELTQTMMMYCLFRHGSATVFKETVVQVSGRLLVRQASLGVIQRIIEKVSINITQRVIGQFISRWLPLLGSAAIGTFSYRDTKKVAANAIDAFEREIEAQVIEVTALPMEGQPPART